MSQLYLSLFIFGAFIIVFVLLFNWWQERKFKREMSLRFGTPINDVLMNSTDLDTDEDRNTVAEKSNEVDTQEMPEEEFRIDLNAIPEIKDDFSYKTSDTPEPVVDDQMPSPQTPTVADPEVTSTAMLPDEKTETTLTETSIETAPEKTFTTEPPPENAAEAIEQAMPTEQEPMSSAIEEQTHNAAEDDEPTDAAGISDLPVNVDPYIDEIAIIVLDQPRSDNEVRHALLPLPIFKKTVQWLGEDSDGNIFQILEEQEQAEFSRIIAALQLVDRSGIVNGEELQNFRAKVRDLAQHFNSVPDWHQQDDVPQYAHELDQFCIEVDVVISMQLLAESGGVFAAVKLLGLIEAEGGVLQEDGRFHFADDAGITQFMISSLDGKPIKMLSFRQAMLQGVMLQMDIPYVVDTMVAFDRMMRIGQILEKALTAKLTDENQLPLGNVQIETIRQQLRAMASKLQDRNIAPGSPTAFRLFS